jgi:hypothetical protein
LGKALGRHSLGLDSFSSTALKQQQQQQKKTGLFWKEKGK